MTIAIAVAHHRQITISRTFPWPMWNYRTFPGFPGGWPRRAYSRRWSRRPVCHVTEEALSQDGTAEGQWTSVRRNASSQPPNDEYCTTDLNRMQYQRHTGLRIWYVMALLFELCSGRYGSLGYKKALIARCVITWQVTPHSCHGPWQELRGVTPDHGSHSVPATRHK